MYINAYILYKFRIIIYCELSHENFIFLINSLHKIGYETEITDNGEFSHYILEGNEQSNIHTVWADEDTYLDIIETAKFLKDEK